jgi:hypothetical protein
MFVLPKGGIQIFKYAEGWENDRSSRAVEKYISDLPLNFMVGWCQEQGWTVRQWNVDGQAGARAFKNGLHPIRSRYQIIRKREILGKVHFWGDTLDLAFDM